MADLDLLVLTGWIFSIIVFIKGIDLVKEGVRAVRLRNDRIELENEERKQALDNSGEPSSGMAG